MVRLALFASAVVGLAAAQAPDALPIDDLASIEVPTYTVPLGLDADIVPYSKSDALAAVEDDIQDAPLTVFPAAPDEPINSAGQDDSTVSARDIGFERRAACDAQTTIPNYYGVDVSSYAAFKADPIIASTALGAATPSGYLNNFKNAPGANNAYAYLGYAIVNKGRTGYDTQWCANKCDAISGCLSFNVYFERDPVLEPGNGCRNPAAFANIKCSFWGTGLDSKTAVNYGQYRADFQVAVAGSNAYTSAKLGGPVGPYTTVQKLDTTIVNAPLEDCTGTWSYLGYKLYQSGPYDPTLCGAACDAQTDYNAAHPVAGKTPVVCSGFGSYILTMTNRTASYQQGQMCTLYTVNVDKSYAAGNDKAFNDGIGAKYTYSYSFFYSRADRQPTCPSQSG